MRAREHPLGPVRATGSQIRCFLTAGDGILGGFPGAGPGRTRWAKQERAGADFGDARPSRRFVPSGAADPGRFRSRPSAAPGLWRSRCDRPQPGIPEAPSSCTCTRPSPSRRTASRWAGRESSSMRRRPRAPPTTTGKPGPGAGPPSSSGPAAAAVSARNGTGARARSAGRRSMSGKPPIPRTARSRWKGCS